MIVVIWVALFPVAVVVGALFARLMSVWKIHPYLILLALFGVPIASSYILGRHLNPFSESHLTLENLAIFAPPLIVGMFIGYLIAETRSPQDN